MPRSIPCRGSEGNAYPGVLRHGLAVFFLFSGKELTMVGVLARDVLSMVWEFQEFQDDICVWFDNFSLQRYE